MEAAYAGYQGRFGDTRLPPMDVDYQEEIRSYPTWVVVSGSGGIIGGVIMSLDADGAAILNIAVHPSSQGQGVGGGLMRHAEQMACDCGADRLSLATHVLLTENLSLYKHFGYAEVARDKTRVRMSKALECNDLQRR